MAETGSRGRWLVLGVVAVVALLAAASGQAAKTSPGIAWSPTSLTFTLDPGDNTSGSASFTSSKPLSTVKVRAVPGIAPFVTPTPSSLASLAAGTAQMVNFNVSVPANAVPGIYSGAIQVSAGGKNQPKPLPVTIDVQGVTSLTTTLSATSIDTGGSVTDHATITGAAPTAAGTIAYKVYDNGTCTGAPVADATPSANTVSNATAPASKSVQFNSPGSYYWQASYSGDPATATIGSTSTCTDEKLTVTAPSSNCTSDGTIGCPWQIDDLATYSQSLWGDTTGNSSAATLLTDDYDAEYQANAGVLEVGIHGLGGYSIVFTDADSVLTYLPSKGAPTALTADVLNPTSTSSGEFGGRVTALKLNVDFSDAGYLTGTSGLKFGDITVCGTPYSDLNGLTVRQVLAIENTALGGGTTTENAADLDVVAQNLNASFIPGFAPSTWAQQHLENGTCGWHPGDLTTYAQGVWGDPTTVGGDTLSSDYGSVYASSFDVVEIGIPGSTGFSLRFTDASYVQAYLPQTGAPGALDADIDNPTSSSSGWFGGDVLALQLNVDFGDAGVLPANSGVTFGDLTVCGLTSDTDLNSETVRQVLSIENTALGGGTTTDSLADLDSIAETLNQTFLPGGAPSSWAQDHLQPGACP